MDWKAEYEKKLVSSHEAVKIVKSGDRVHVPLTYQPQVLLNALAERKHELKGVRLILGVSDMDLSWYEPGIEDSILIQNEIVMMDAQRELLEEMRAEHINILQGSYFKAQEERKGEIREAEVDVAIVRVTPPDKNGYCSFGTNPWHKKTACRLAKKSITLVDDELERLYLRDNYIHVSEIDCFVHEPSPTPMRGLSIVPEVPDELRKLAKHAASLIKDGDCIQIGWGASMQAIAEIIFDEEPREDLGVHTELIFPGVVWAVQKGIITGKRKTLHREKVVCTAFVFMGQEEMAFIEDNPAFELYGMEYVCDPRVIASNDNMVAMNEAISVDLTGQINTESFGTLQYAAPGGQLEFAIGAMLSRGGRNITILESTARQGAFSRIVPTFPEGTGVSIPRLYADYIITEYGIARLLGKSNRERCRELIAIAHPKFREDLKSKAEEFYGGSYDI
ncbi:MAG: acetyl-CoA hydrolase/transferase family protein [Desulfobacteraceae bacterium]|nr:acetyl-CoA hydrolase/transferase family protein [Desulfobacteraceae bacterium]